MKVKITFAKVIAGIALNTAKAASLYSTHHPK